jgi:hypothetical protein
MTVDQAILGGLCVIIALYLLYSLRAGRVPATFYSLDRDQRPLLYWSAIAANIVILGAILWGLFSGQYSN